MLHVLFSRSALPKVILAVIFAVGGFMTLMSRWHHNCGAYRQKQPPCGMNQSYLTLDVEQQSIVGDNSDGRWNVEECYFSSRFNQGDIPVASCDLNKETWKHEYDQTESSLFDESCNWKVEETLTPIGNGQMRYQYSEKLLGCKDKSVEKRFVACERSGIVSCISGY